MSHITTQQLSKMAGITKRHCQRLLVAGDVTDAVRTSGGHWSIPDSAKVRKWCKGMRVGKHQRRSDRVYSAPVVPSAKVKHVEIPTGNELHKCRENLKKAQAAMDATISAIRANAYAGGLLLIAAYNENSGGAWMPWLKANGISKAEARRLMNFAKLCEKGRGNHPIEMLRNFGFIPPIDRKNSPQKKTKIKSSNWYGLSTKLTVSLDDLMRDVSLSQMGEMRRFAIAQQLKPIVDLYKKLSH
jgi:hypothetical protein